MDPSFEISNRKMCQVFWSLGRPYLSLEVCNNWRNICPISMPGLLRKKLLVAVWCLLEIEPHYVLSALRIEAKNARKISTYFQLHRVRKTFVLGLTTEMARLLVNEVRTQRQTKKKGKNVAEYFLQVSIIKSVKTESHYGEKRVIKNTAAKENIK